MVGVASGWRAHIAIITDRLNDRELQYFWTVFAGIEDDYEQRLAAKL
jgi:hypothetical protein